MSDFKDFFKSRATVQTETVQVILKLPEDGDNTRFPFFHAYVVKMGKDGFIEKGWSKRFAEAFDPNKVKSYCADYRTWATCTNFQIDQLEKARLNCAI